MFNIGAVFTAGKTKPAGVYIAINGVIFDHDRVRKDVENNKFVAL
jgi:L-asparaginase